MRYRPAGLDIEPAPAESWTVSLDGRTYTFAARKGCEFHDGAGAMRGLAGISPQAVETCGKDVSPDGGGTGPFESVGWVTGQGIVLPADEGYARGAPALDGHDDDLVRESLEGSLLRHDPEEDADQQRREVRRLVGGGRPSIQGSRGP